MWKWVTACSLLATLALAGVDLDGSGAYIVVPDTTDSPLDITDEITVSVWFKADDTGNSGLLAKSNLSDDSGAVYRMLVFDGLSWRINGNGSTVGSADLELGKLYNAVGTYNGRISRLWTNGVFAGNDTYSTAIATDNEPLNIGVHFSDLYTFDGEIYRTTIWNKAMTVDEVAEYYASGASYKPVDDFNVVDLASTNNGISSNGVPVYGNQGEVHYRTFDGTNMFDCGAAPDVLTQYVTYMCWARFRSLTSASGNYQGLISTAWNGAEFGCVIFLNEATGKIDWYIDEGPWEFISSDSALSTDTWYHIAATRDEADDTMRLYIDGILQADTAVASTNLYPVGDKRLLLGSYAGGAAYQFDGDMAMPAIFNTGLASNQIYDIYTRGRTFIPTNDSLVSVWDMKAPTLAPVLDITSAKGYTDGDVIFNNTTSTGWDDNRYRLKPDESYDVGLAHFWNPSDNNTTNDLVGSNDAQLVSPLTNGVQGWDMGYLTNTMYATLGGTITNGTNYSVGGWVFVDKVAMDNNTTGGWLIADRTTGAGLDDWQMLYLKASAKLEFAVFDSAGTLNSVTQSANTVQEWMHVMGVCDADNSEIRLYINGGLDATETLGIVPNDGSTAKPAIGTVPWSLGQADTKWHGIIDKVRFYTNALTDAEVYQVYQSSALITPTVYDLSGNALNATATNGVVQATAQVEQDNSVAVDSQGSVNLDNVGATVIGQEGEDFYADFATDVYFKSTELDVLTNLTTGAYGYWYNTPDDSDVGIEWGVGRNADATLSDLWGRVYDTASGNDRYDAWVRTDGTTQWRFFTGTDSYDPYYGKWTHICIVQDGVEPKIYFDGVEQVVVKDTTTDTTAWFKDIFDAASPADSFTLGTLLSNGGPLVGEYGDGKMRDFFIDNTALSSGQVYSIAVSNTLPPDPVVFYRFKPYTTPYPTINPRRKRR